MCAPEGEEGGLLPGFSFVPCLFPPRRHSRRGNHALFSLEALNPLFHPHPYQPFVGATWFKRGSGQQFEIPTRWGPVGHINLIGTYSVSGREEFLEVRELEGTCNGEQVIAYLDTLAAGCTAEKLTVVALDNAPFHRGAKLREKITAWEEKGLYLRSLPPYAPFLNLIEDVWRKLKGILMPRRCYNSIPELREALLTGLKILGARCI